MLPTAATLLIAACSSSYTTTALQDEGGPAAAAATAGIFGQPPFPYEVSGSSVYSVVQTSTLPHSFIHWEPNHQLADKCKSAEHRCDCGRSRYCHKPPALS